MKPGILDRFEERFVFNISRYFFHTLVGITVVAMGIALLVVLYGLTPSLKRSVDRPEYPQPAEITLEELSAVLNPAKTSQPQSEHSSRQETASAPVPAEGAPVDTAQQKKYERSYSELQTLIPPEKYPWDNVGHWRKNWYRNEWVISRYGIKHYLQEAFKQAGANTFGNYARLIDSYLPVVRKFEESDRMKALIALTHYSKDDIRTAETNVQLLDTLMSAYGQSDANIIYKLAEFGKKNPRDGAAFLKHVAGKIGHFAEDQRENVLNNMISSYYAMFNNRVDKQMRISDAFLPLLPGIDGPEQPQALAEFYKLYIAKNAAWEAEVARLDARYQREIQNAESEVMTARVAKSELRMKALMLLVGSIGTVSVLALLLVLLSMQRQLKGLRNNAAKENEAVGELVG